MQRFKDAHTQLMYEHIYVQQEESTAYFKQIY